MADCHPPGYVVLRIFNIPELTKLYDLQKQPINLKEEILFFLSEQMVLRRIKMFVKEKTQSKLLFLFAIGIVFVIITVCRVTNTPMAIKADTEKPIKCRYNTQTAQKSEYPSQGTGSNQQMPEVAVETPRVEAICVSDSGKSSIYVQGEFAYEGDTVDGFRILKIYSNKVEFEKNGKTITAVFPQP